MTSVIHVATTGSDTADGSESRPFRTIDHAAQVALPGDTVRVHAGVYREWVVPRRGGISDARRIVYEAAPGEHVVIKGSERVTGWEPVAGTVWRAAIPRAVFGGFNPFAEEVAGDWIVYRPDAPVKHLGDVYLNGRSFYEASSVAEVSDPVRHTEAVDDWTGSVDRVRDPDQTRYRWYAEVDEEQTTVWANFHGADPNAELVEVNVRRSVFFPAEHHLDYITVRGFELAQAASPWAPPTADQPGLIGPNWAKGWIIEDNIIHDAKCSGISLGKEASTGHNLSTLRDDKPGYQYQLESVFAARRIGWDREHIGSHIVRRNTIFDCGQNGIVGHLGCVFSTIEDNHIHDIAVKREFYGYEIAGIKLHAAIDVEIRRNRIQDCTLGIWLDWQTQGTRISRNVLFENSRDLFVEVSHGPYLADHNVFASRASLELFSQGGAFVNNLICGTVRIESVLDRATPYHLPHSTQVAGYALIHGGDDRFIANVFLGGDVADAYGPDAEAVAAPGYGTAGYDGHPSSFGEYLAEIAAQPPGDHQRYFGVPQAVYIRDNAYANGAVPFGAESGSVVVDEPVEVSAIEEDGTLYLELTIPATLARAVGERVEGRDLERVRFVDADFEEPDGSPARIDIDLAGVRKEPGTAYPAGPLADLAPGRSRIRVW